MVSLAQFLVFLYVRLLIVIMPCIQQRASRSRELHPVPYTHGYCYFCKVCVPQKKPLLGDWVGAELKLKSHLRH